MECIFTLFVTEVTPQGVTFRNEYRVNRARFHSLSIEFYSILEHSQLESSEIHSSTSEISSLHRWSELFTRFLEVVINMQC